MASQQYKVMCPKCKKWRRSNSRMQRYHRGCVDKKNILGWGNIRENILKRDMFVCQCCKRKDLKLCIHHIDCNRKNNKENNLITICDNCHLQLHRRNSNYKLKKNKIYGLFPSSFRYGMWGTRWVN
jgi:5-methylcytosine-specific restriction endonuclease McrA